MNKCKCDNCEYCRGVIHDTRRGFHCEHPNQKHIVEYFRKNKIKKMPAFIGFSENFSDVPKNKTTPKWCPLSEVVNNE